MRRDGLLAHVHDQLRHRAFRGLVDLGKWEAQVTKATTTFRKGTFLALHDVAAPGPWATQGACKGMPVGWWFPGRGKFDYVNSAARLCATCPVRAECAAYALANPLLQGTWGGMSARQRQLTRRRQRWVSGMGTKVTATSS